MDLALELGWPAEWLARNMTEREFRRWHVYRSRKLLPSQRIEYYLAQVAYMIAVTMGGAKNAKISDFLLQIEKQEAEPEDVVQAAREAFGYNPRRKVTDG